MRIRRLGEEIRVLAVKPEARYGVLHYDTSSLALTVSRNVSDGFGGIRSGAAIYRHLRPVTLLASARHVDVTAAGSSGANVRPVTLPIARTETTLCNHELSNQSPAQRRTAYISTSLTAAQHQCGRADKISLCSCLNATYVCHPVLLFAVTIQTHVPPQCIANSLSGCTTPGREKFRPRPLLSAPTVRP